MNILKNNIILITVKTKLPSKKDNLQEILIGPKVTQDQENQMFPYRQSQCCTISLVYICTDSLRR